LDKLYKGGKGNIETWDCKWEMIHILYFVDNQIVIAGDEVDLSYMIRKLQAAHEQRGLIINKKKSQCMILGNNEEENLPVEDGINGVDTCKYMAVLFSKNSNSNKEIIELTKVETLLGL
jgi:hypothetical protein